MNYSCSWTRKKRPKSGWRVRRLRAFLAALALLLRSLVWRIAWEAMILFPIFFFRWKVSLASSWRASQSGHWLQSRKPALQPRRRSLVQRHCLLCCLPWDASTSGRCSSRPDWSIGSHRNTCSPWVRCSVLPSCFKVSAASFDLPQPMLRLSKVSVNRREVKIAIPRRHARREASWIPTVHFTGTRRMILSAPSMTTKTLPSGAHSTSRTRPIPCKISSRSTRA